MVHMADRPIDPELINDNVELTVKRVAGGSVIDLRPIFSSDAATLFLVRGFTIRSYSVKTGEYIRSYDGFNSSPIVAFQLHPNNRDLLVGCSEIGEVIEWKWKTGLPGRKVTLALPPSATGEPLAVRGFRLVRGRDADGGTVWDVLAALFQVDTPALDMAVFCSQSGVLKRGDLQFWMNNDSHSIAAGCSDGVEYLATISIKTLYIIYQSTMKGRKLLSPERLTCVSCHPEKAIVATGDTRGRIIIWNHVLNEQRQPQRTIYHWHTLPVQDVVFSDAGSFFYSGGGECVLVKWTLNSPSVRSYLPRLAGPIAHLAMAPDNQFVAVSTRDNAIQVVDPQFSIVTSIQHLSLGVMTGLSRGLFAAGISVDPRSRTLVLNGRIGHVQFYCPNKKMLLYNLDITGHNYMTQEQSKVLVNMDVVQTAMSADGSWLATVEERDDGETSVECRLKFWRHDAATQEFALSTVVELPHAGAVTAVRFQPSADAGQMMAVTAGRDDKFRMWSLVRTYGPGRPSGVMWQCESVGFHKNLPIGAVSFSHDGSLLAVAFAVTLTVWVPETNQLKCSLTHATLNRTIRHVEFGHKDACHLVVTASDICIGVWNLLSLSLLWTVDVGVSLLVPDPRSSVMAVFTTDNSMFVFSPLSFEPIYERKAVARGGAKVLTAVFVPHKILRIKPHGSWQAQSQLYFIDSNQELMTLERTDEIDEMEGLSILPARANVPLTPFAALLAQQTVSNVKRPQSVPHRQLGVPGADTVRELLCAPSHTMPSLTLLCGAFLRSFAIVKNSENVEELKSEKMDVGPNQDENMDGSNSRQVTQTQTNTNLEKQLEPLLYESYDWVQEYIVDTR